MIDDNLDEDFEEEDKDIVPKASKIDLNDPKYKTLKKAFPKVYQDLLDLVSENTELSQKLKHTRKLTKKIRKQAEKQTIALNGNVIGKTDVGAQYQQSEYTLGIGQTVGNYEIANTLGKGGMGEVYAVKLSLDKMTERALSEVKGRLDMEDIKAVRDLTKAPLEEITKQAEQEEAKKIVAGDIKRKYGIESFTEAAETIYAFKKMLGIQNPNAVKRFEKEVASLVSLSDLDGVVKVFDYSLDKDNLYIVMEFVKSNLPKKQTDEKTAVEIAKRAGKALQSVHERGIIHRDIKPDNILGYINEKGELVSCKISDFGLGKDLEDEHNVTLSQERFGTPYYMALEQALKSKDADARSDVFSLGASLFYWLTGKYPLYTFEFDNDYETLRQSQTFDQSTLAKNMGDLLNFPSDIIKIDKKLEAVILKSMAKKREDRYQSAKEFVEDLERYQKGLDPLVLVNDPDFVEKRRIQQTGAESFVSEKKYREGREAVEKQIADLRSKKADKKLVERYSLALGKYPDRIRPRLAEMKEYMSSCSADEFVANIPEFLELIYECKIVPVERRIGADKFPSVTDESGKWKLNDGNISSNGYWVDIQEIGNFKNNVENRVVYLRNKDPTCIILEDFLKIFMTFGKDYDKTNNKESQKIMLQRANTLEAQYKKNKERFIQMWDKEKWDAQGQKLGGTALGVESLMILDELFDVNKHTPDNRYAKMAVKQIDAIIDNLMREDGSVFRYGVFDENGKLKSKYTDLFSFDKEGNVIPDIYDKFENEKNISKYTQAKAQAYLIKGLVDAFKHTKDKKYLDTANKAINFFIKNLSGDLISYYAINDPKGKEAIKNSAATAMVASSLIDYADLTGNKAAREHAVKLLKALVKHKLDVSKEYEGLIKGYRDADFAKENSSVESDWFFLKTLSKLEKNILYESRNLISTKIEGKLDWNNSTYQAGFTRLDNAFADEQTEVRVMHDDDSLYFRLRAFGDEKNDFYDVMIGDKRFKVELKNGIGAGKVAFTKLGFYEKPEELKFNIVRNRKDENGKRTTISSWSPNDADLYLEDKKMYFDAKDKLKPEYGTLILK